MGAITYDEAKGALKTLSAFVDQQAPAPLPPPSGSLFTPGLVSGTDLTNDVPAAAALGAKTVRVEWDIATAPAKMEPVIAAYASKGIRVAPLAGFSGRLPTQAEALNLVTWAKAFGAGGTFWKGQPGKPIQTIEFGNETEYGYQYNDGYQDASYKLRARTIAQRVKEASMALAVAVINVGLIVPASDGGSGQSVWIDEMFAAVPDLAKYVAGWTVHPYNAPGIGKIERMIRFLATHGETKLPIYATEFGIATDGDHKLTPGPNEEAAITYERAAVILEGQIAAIRKAAQGRLAGLDLYQVRDQQPTGRGTNHEWYFGALQHEGQLKAEYTEAVKALLAST